MKIVANKAYKYIGHNKIEVRDCKSWALLYTTEVEDWEGVPEPIIIKIVYPDGRIKTPTEKAQQVYHSKHLFTGEPCPELEARTASINKELKRLGISKNRIGYRRHWEQILKIINI